MLPQTAPIPSFLWPLKPGREGESSSQPWNVTGDQGEKLSGAPPVPSSLCLPVHKARSLIGFPAGGCRIAQSPPSRAVKIEIFLQILDETDTNIPPKTLAPLRPYPTIDARMCKCRSRCLDNRTSRRATPS